MGETAADVILPLRDAVDSFVNVRPATVYPGVDAVRPRRISSSFAKIRRVYSGHEDRLSDDLSTLTRVVTSSASEQLAAFACEFVEDNGYDGFHVAHKANVMRETDGRFRDSVVSVADERGVETEEVLMDAFATHVCLDPTQFDVVVCPNLAGTSSPIWPPVSSAVSACSRAPTSAPSAACSSPSTAPHPTSPVRVSRTRRDDHLRRDDARAPRPRRGRKARA